MAKKKLTHRGILSLLKTPHPKRVDYFHTGHKGLCLTIGPKSASWYYFVRVDGKQTRLKLGEWGTMGLEAATKAADAVEAQIARGEHPKAAQARRRAEKSQARRIDRDRVFENVCEAWEAYHLPTVADQTAAMYRRAIRRMREVFEGRDIGTIKRGELVRLLDRVKAATKSGIPANHLAATMRLLFGYALDRLELETNPAAGLKNPVKKTNVRDRIFDRREIRILWRACEEAGYPFGDALRFMLCTGQRSGEVGSIRRDDVRDGFWVLSRNKTSKRIDIYLADQAATILEGCPNFGSAAPYFSASGGEIALRPDGMHNALNRHIRPRLKKAAEELGLPPITEHWTPHALRHTVRSGLTGWCGVLPDIAERTINHAIGGMSRVYDHADYRPHVAEALKVWDEELSRILEGKDAKVVSIRRTA